MTTKGQPGNRVMVNGVPITKKLTDALQNLIDMDPASSKNLLAETNLYIMSIPDPNLEQIDREFYALQRNVHELLTALEGKEGTNEEH